MTPNAYLMIGIFILSIIIVWIISERMKEDLDKEDE